MATVIRMRRGGRTHKPYYRIVVQDSRARDRGPEVDTIGVYHPCARPEPLSEVDAHKALDWLAKGAGMSDTARSVLRRAGVLKHFAEGTKPEEAVVVIKSGKVEDKGYNAPPPPKEEPAPKKEEAPAAEESAEAAEASGEAEETAAEAPAEAETAEQAPAEEEKAE